ncbi:head fiber protein [Bifidobacterium biavatii]|uniref:Head fiber protein n=1 Tax=Bifidobacterium biavatii DSM 23969 TaxID=1437608 RepID=A0A086ZU18_9BIFI|nr:hypothetical protein BBIA_2151 [Bifidobacterium biavatii DSM 23969]
MAAPLTQTLVVQEDTETVDGGLVIPVRLVKPDGTPFGGGTGTVTVAWADITGKPATFPASAASIADATRIGTALLTAANAASARTAIGAGTPYTLPAAGTAIGGVKKGAAVAAVTVADPAAAAAAPTKAEYDALLALAKANKVAINGLIASLKAAGTIA